MTLKRVTKQQESKGATNTSNALSSAKTGAFISRLAGGLCFDFNPEDSNTYIVGTDDGNIHRCSCTLSEQYLATHFGHTGPVYRIRWSPFLSGTFLSCSADWTVRLWNQDSEDATLRFQSGKDSVSDIAWSPNSSTVFGCVSIDGSFAIWDLGFSVLDPVILHSVLDRKLTCIVFAENSPSVMIGDDTGSVNVYKIHNLANISNLTDQEQADLLAKVVDTSLMSRVAPVA